MKKKMKRGRDKFTKYKSVICFIGKVFNLFPKSLQKKLLISARNIDSTIGIAYRYILLKNLAKSVGDNVCIKSGVYLLSIENISFGNNVSIHPMCYLDGQGGLSIGNDVSIAESTSLISFEHNYKSQDFPIKDQGITLGEIIIKDNVWIGANTTVLSGVTVNSGAIIGAGSVVTKNIEKNIIAAGNPAKKIKDRI